MKTYRVLGRLLSYPDQELQKYMGELKQALCDERMVKGRTLNHLMGFMDRLAYGDLIDLQEDYVALFDRGKGHSLFIFEHIHGDSRDRGPAMVDLIESYREHGFEMAQGELPDYMPLFLEFLSLLPPEESQDYLNEVIQIFAVIGAKLMDKGSDYNLVFRAIEALAETKVSPEVLAVALEQSETIEESFEAMDREWEEQPAFSGAPDANSMNGCNSCGPGLSAPRVDLGGQS